MFKIFVLKNGLSNIKDFYCGGVNAGLRSRKDQGDLAFIRSDKLCTITAVYTANRFRAAPLRHALRYGKTFKGNFILVNAKNANAMTGEAGIRDIETIFSKHCGSLKANCASIFLLIIMSELFIPLINLL